MTPTNVTRVGGAETPPVFAPTCLLRMVGGDPTVIQFDHESFNDQGFRLDEWVRRQLSAGPSVVAAAVFADDSEALADGRVSSDEANGNGSTGNGSNGNGASPDDHGAVCCRLSLAVAGLGSAEGERWNYKGDPSTTALRTLRQWASEQLADLPVPIDDVVLALSELATNVERYADEYLNVDLIHTEGLLVAAVTDPLAEQLPCRRQAAPDELAGRGLMVVSALALAWGVVVRASKKTVWAAFPVGAN